MSAIERVQQLSRNLYFHQTVPLFSDGALAAGLVGPGRFSGRDSASELFIRELDVVATLEVLGRATKLVLQIGRQIGRGLRCGRWESECVRTWMTRRSHVSKHA